MLAALCLSIGFAVAAAARSGSVRIPRGRLTAVLLVLPVLQALSALWSASPMRALESAAFTLIWVAGILWLSTLDARARLQLAIVAAVGVTVSAAVMALQIGGLQVFNLGGRFASGRLSLTGFTGNPADLAMAAVLLLPLLLVRRETAARPRLQISLVLLLSLATLLTRTLSGVGALIAVFVVWLIQQRSRKLWLRAAAVGAVLLAVALTAGLDKRLARGYHMLQQGNWYQLLSARGDGWSAAVEMVRNRPVLGVGAANYDHLYYPSRLASLGRHGGTGGRGELASHFDRAHCDPLQLAAELGVIGILWLATLAVLLVKDRKRAGPILGLAAAASIPFALLHYPTHVAVGLIPISLILSDIVGKTAIIQPVDWRRGRAPVVILVIVATVVGTGWQLRRVAADLWMGSLEMVLAASQQAAPEIRVQRAAAIEAAVVSRIARMPRQAPALWRTVGRSRLMRQDFRAAEQAFRKAYDGWPHEDAEFYIGLSLVAQGRRGEGLQHLGRVCRTNPALVRLIHDPDIRRAVEDILDVYRAN